MENITIFFLIAIYSLFGIAIALISGDENLGKLVEHISNPREMTYLSLFLIIALAPCLIVTAILFYALPWVGRSIRDLLKRLDKRILK